MTGLRRHTGEGGGSLSVPVFRVVLSVLALSFFLSVPAFSAANRDKEETALMKAAREFLEAELQQDHPAVYRCFAPSSPYAKGHSYDEYLRDAQSSEDRVVAYTIQNITYIHDNEDRVKWPSVEKIAQVEVDMVFSHIPTDRRSEINIGLIFLKEGGKWYKS